MVKKRLRRVALLVETSLGSGREILRGIARYAHQVDQWQLHHVARGLNERMPDWLERWEGDGVIARIQDEATTEALLALGLPVVDVLGVAPSRGVPLVHVDDRAISALVAEHFGSRKFQHVAFFGIEDENWSVQRREGFLRACNDSGARSCQVFEMSRRDSGDSPQSRRELRRWLRELPQPVGIMVCSDQRGLVLLEACREEGLSVPERIAVVSVDNDETLCEISSPPLSSVRAGHGQVGFEAAKLLDEWMAEGKKPSQTILVPPRELVVRRSSELQAVEDPQVAEGLHYIHEHLGEALNNETVARAAGISRTLFQRQFRDTLGMTVRHYVIHERLRRAQSLIESTDLTLADIAEQVGFRHQEYMGTVFRQRLGITPASLRRAALEEASAP